jgi:hypothetical protein
MVYDNPDYPWALMVMNSQTQMFDFVYRNEQYLLVTDISVLGAMCNSNQWYRIQQKPLDTLARTSV